MWWWTQAVVVFLFIVFLLAIQQISGRCARLSSFKGVKNDVYLQSLQPSERHKERSEMLSTASNMIYALILGLLFLLWAHLVIEIKRWHDLELSGYCVWFRILPAMAHVFLGGLVSTFVAIVVPIGLVYFLGFRRGICADSQGFVEPPRSRWAVLNDVGGPVGLMVFVVALFKFGFISLPPDTTFDFK